MNLFSETSKLVKLCVTTYIFAAMFFSSIQLYSQAPIIRNGYFDELNDDLSVSCPIGRTGNAANGTGEDDNAIHWDVNQSKCKYWYNPTNSVPRDVQGWNTVTTTPDFFHVPTPLKLDRNSTFVSC